jgi:hypothetical protein
VCQPGTPEACTIPNACNVAECDGQLGCVLHPVEDGTRCGDRVCEGSNAWTKPRTCESGTCRPADPALACDDGDPCTKDGCQPKTGCTHTPEKDGTECGEATCTAGGDHVAARRCKAAICGAAPEPASCDDGIACTADSCDPVKGCSHVAVTGVRLGAWGVMGYEADGVCAGLALDDCDDHDPCTRDGCDPVTGCTHDAWPDGTPCGDGVTCNSGTCQ